jgi:hypothetical protein
MRSSSSESLQKSVGILRIFCNNCVKTAISPVVPDLCDTLYNTASVFFL